MAAGEPTLSKARQATAHHYQKLVFDYVHVAVGDYTRFAYAEVCPMRKALHGVPHQGCSRHGSPRGTGQTRPRAPSTVLIKYRHPWQNGKAEL